MENYFTGKFKEDFQNKVLGLYKAETIKDLEPHFKGIAYQTLYKYVTWRTEPPLGFLFKIRKEKGVTIDWLLGGEDRVASTSFLLTIQPGGVPVIQRVEEMEPIDMTEEAPKKSVKAK